VVEARDVFVWDRQVEKKGGGDEGNFILVFSYIREIFIRHRSI